MPSDAAWDAAGALKKALPKWAWGEEHRRPKWACGEGDMGVCVPWLSIEVADVVCQRLD